MQVWAIHVPEASVMRVDPVFRSVIRCKGGKTVLVKLGIKAAKNYILELNLSWNKNLIVKSIYFRVYSIR